ncbi:MAG: YraN family protein [Calditrichaeota bacterium]|nr:YraN family protein [Calditrichota bacterium]MCB9366421.1 YraN family protein [Calditrichota bacterium]
MFENWFRKLFSRTSRTDGQKLGERGEKLAKDYLRKQGLRLLERNWRTSFGELDIICKEGETVVFVEVKTAGKPTEFAPANRVTRDKQRRIKRLADAYLRSSHLECPRRFDIVTVIQDGNQFHIEHFKNAFV